eukprot:366321-Chlamydomonas_euryale.AAC.4
MESLPPMASPLPTTSPHPQPDSRAHFLLFVNSAATRASAGCSQGAVCCHEEAGEKRVGAVAVQAFQCRALRCGESWGCCCPGLPVQSPAVLGELGLLLSRPSSAELCIWRSGRAQTTASAGDALGNVGDGNLNCWLQFRDSLIQASPHVGLRLACAQPRRSNCKHAGCAC